MQFVVTKCELRVLGALYAILLITALAATRPLAAQQPQNRQANRSSSRTLDSAALDQYVARAARNWHVPGLAIAVVKDDSLVFAKGYGVLERGKPAPVTIHTRFAIGSTTKAMTTAIIAMLVDEGRLRWDDRVIDYLPEFRLYDPYVTRELTVRDLLTHRSGLPGTELFWYTVPENAGGMPEIMRQLRYVKPASSFRSEFAYQNVVYAIAGVLAERVAGMSWETLMRTRIFEPLGMTESIPLVSGIAGKGNVALPHAEIRDTVRVVPVRSTDVVASAGSVWSSVSDMSKWMRFMLDSGRVGTKRLIAPATFREIVAPQIRVPMGFYPELKLSRPSFLSYALGWFVQDYRGQTVWMHVGGIDGMSALIGLLPDQGVGVFVLANLENAEVRHALMYRVFDMYDGESSRDWSAEVRTLLSTQRGARARAPSGVSGTPPTHPSLPLDRFAGTYTDSAFGNVEVTLANGILRAWFGRADLGELEPWQYDSFRGRVARSLGGEEQPTVLSFVSDGSGRVSAVRAYGVTFLRCTLDVRCRMSSRSPSSSVP